MMSLIVCFWFVATCSVLDNGTITVKVERTTICITATVSKWTIWVKEFIACIRKINGTIGRNSDKYAFKYETLIICRFSCNVCATNRFWIRLCLVKEFPNITRRLRKIKYFLFLKWIVNFRKPLPSSKFLRKIFYLFHQGIKTGKKILP